MARMLPRPPRAVRPLPLPPPRPRPRPPPRPRPRPRPPPRPRPRPRPRPPPRVINTNAKRQPRASKRDHRIRTLLLDSLNITLLGRLAIDDLGAVRTLLTAAATLVLEPHRVRRT